jgi:hypothetical protein
MKRIKGFGPWIELPELVRYWGNKKAGLSFSA